MRRYVHIQITQQQFDLALQAHKSEPTKRLRLTELSIEIAHQVLVQGKPQGNVAREFGRSKQWVSEIVRRFLLLALSGEEIPVGWVRNTATLPRKDWPRVRAMEARARADYALKLASASAKKRVLKRRRGQP